MAARIHPPVKYHGGKYYTSKWIIGHFPDHQTYVEPFGGAGNVLLNKPRAATDVYGDKYPDIVNLMSVIRDRCPELLERLRKLTYCPETHAAAWASKGTHADPLDWAENYYIIGRMSRSGEGGKTFSWSKRMYGGIPEAVRCWLTSLDWLPRISERLQGVVTANSSAVELMGQYDSPSALFYCDPPYVHSSRSKSNLKKYNTEMNDDQHRDLAAFLNSCKAKVIVSGYPSALYDEVFAGWRVEEKEVPDHAAQKKSEKELKRECLWLNF